MHIGECLKCPYCGCKRSKVEYKRYRKNYQFEYNKRGRVCLGCQNKFGTYEIDESLFKKIFKVVKMVYELEKKLEE